ncbi:hypothetical protein ACFFJY_10255 [Fictibacillus aquaticus]|uniref:Translation initiation factor 2 n=1 Tax=Fictibacillus aquaticus TaxID=2021314 RepID=A0A235FBN8_9BACL|nr:hypothetical protein [Fictibacillus aquaticus]OYD58642.1 hypothetical protein CGZ90_01705 [Fictibacillus aquaticus]
MEKRVSGGILSAIEQQSSISPYNQYSPYDSNNTLSPEEYETNYGTILAIIGAVFTVIGDSLALIGGMIQFRQDIENNRDSSTDTDEMKKQILELQRQVKALQINQGTDQHR